ncbi:OTU domain-containing protein [Heracleum sosnowskyi]|uniref:Ubiquitin thioesterase OTU n=1 Tax=Heracleum sosnowskyi TaxID=360622 RepID=A0AAD8N6G0_9APIA|nr:OTU domain-containing protein [Heracleum sosnowskyi]
MNVCDEIHQKALSKGRENLIPDNSIFDRGKNQLISNKKEEEKKQLKQTGSPYDRKNPEVLESSVHSCLNLRTESQPIPSSSSSCLTKNLSTYLDMFILRRSRCLPVAGLQMFQKRCFRPSFSKQRINMNTPTVNAEVLHATKNADEECGSSSVSHSHGKQVYTDYSIIGIPGDGRCMFRSVAHGACVRSGKPAPSERLQKELADELRTCVADEFIKRREETEWFIEGDFNTYVSNIRKPHVWGGEPELLMASHVLQMPITVFMHDKGSGGLISIAEYGQEYGKENPINVLYHGFGHYDALQFPGPSGARSKL